MIKIRIIFLFCTLIVALAVLLLDRAIATVPLDIDSLFPGGPGTMVLDRQGRPLRAYLARDERWRLPATLDSVSPWLIQATLAAEDQRFFRHGGVDGWAVVRAVWGNITGRGRRSGASTLTMQVAGLEDPPPRTWLRKLRQTFRALQLERRLGKRQIFEMYLTHAPYGGNVCGVEAAARKWLGKPARDLTLAESAMIAGLPQAPSRYRPDRRPASARRRMEVVLRRMLEERMITRAEYLRALRQPLAIGAAMDREGGGALRELPRHAPHFSDMARAKAPRPGLVRTTLDLPSQALVERRLRAHVDRLKPEGIHNGAVVVLEVRDGSIRALAGSPDLEDRAHGGQVNAATARRPAGSTLKPLIYAMAYDRGLLQPGESLPDVPTVFAGYRPQNSDRAFRGPVPASAALAWSLNLPAIEVLRRVSVPGALGFLRQAGLGSLSQGADRYGLSLAIGTGQVSLLELTAASATLARDGIHLPPKMFPREPVETRRLLSPGAAYLVNKALAAPDLRPPDEVDPGLLGLEGIAWKTGTSNGRRDAWTIAWNGDLAVGVWIGNVDNRPSPAIQGFTAAAPLALGLLQELTARGGPKAASTPADEAVHEERAWPGAAPAEVGPIVACLDTGAPAAAACPTTASQIGLTGGSRTCPVHRAVLLDVATTTLLCTRCSPGRDSVEVVRAFHPEAMAAWLARNPPTRPPNLPEPHFSGCPSQPPRPGPVILHPRDGEAYLLDPTRPPEAQRLQPKAAGDPTGLIWLLNGQLIEAGAEAASGPGGALPEGAGGPRILLSPGRHRLRAITPDGRASEVAFEVLTIQEDAPAPARPGPGGGR